MQIIGKGFVILADRDLSTGGTMGDYIYIYHGILTGHGFDLLLEVNKSLFCVSIHWYKFNWLVFSTTLFYFFSQEVRVNQNGGGTTKSRDLISHCQVPPGGRCAPCRLAKFHSFVWRFHCALGRNEFIYLFIYLNNRLQ